VPLTSTLEAEVSLGSFVRPIVSNQRIKQEIDLDLSVGSFLSDGSEQF
jgi:hypothetical protein